MSISIDHQIELWHLNANQFKQMLRATQSFVAGSFLVPCVSDAICNWEANDVDIWTMECPLSMSRILDLTKFLLDAGYGFPPTKCDIDFKTDYGRFAQTVKSILTYRHVASKKCVQVLLLKNKACFSAIKIVEHFDLTLVQMYFDAQEHNVITCTHAALYALNNNAIIVALQSQEVQDQSFGEWIRTVGRIVKYEIRRFILYPEASRVFADYIVANIFQKTTCFSALIERLSWWNKALADHIRNNHSQNSSVPLFLLSVCPNNDIRFHTSHLFIVTKTFAKNKYLFQIAWNEIEDQLAETFYPIGVLCDNESKEHTQCISLRHIEINAHLGVFWTPYNMHLITKHLKVRNEDKNIVIVFKSFRHHNYMCLTSLAQLTQTVSEVNEAYQSVELNTTVILSRENLSWILHQTSKRAFEIYYDYTLDENEMPPRHLYTIS